ncbi:lipase family protein [Mucilaginibacter robiniae]|uniref:Lipase family protein n=1 Tax=Mucilaginibacter robiniae TaxID=2728022 RepID=A0A7L5DVB2_9SPHI|nr:lipase family protein [Mucilaginibacter robiniae]QJD95012.1 lipase family protein [Mucilaginibacter robiniae]
MKHLILFVSGLLLCLNTQAQLKPGFDIQEYLEMLRISRQQVDTAMKNDHVPKPQTYHMIYRSAVGPLNNRWDLWINNHQTAVISIRGTTAENVSWLENFYAAMVPATGHLHIDDTTTFNYHLADNPRAAVHIGWLLGLANLSKTIVPQITKLYREQNIHDFIIMGHSQGAAISFLLRSYLADLQQRKQLPADIRFKVYSSAPPKPGNTYYAYAYNYLTRGGWGIAITNAADWVPETPFSIQTVHDFNTLNPFSNINEGTKNQSLLIRLYIKHVYNRLAKPPVRAVKNNQKYLGHLVYKFIKKTLPQFTEPAYAPTNLYVSCGTPIILMPNADYRQKFPDDTKNVFTHHLFWPYYYLAEKEYAH